MIFVSQWYEFGYSRFFIGIDPSRGQQVYLFVREDEFPRNVYSLDF